MKQKIALVLALVVMATSAFSQGSDRFAGSKKGSLVGIHFNALDIQTPITLRNSSTSRTFTKVKDLDFGLSVSYWKGLTKTIDLSVRGGAVLHDFSHIDRATYTDKTEIGFELEPTLNIRPYGDNSLIAPFLTVGIGGGSYTGKLGAYVPTGVGVQFNFLSNTYMFVQAAYRWTLTKDVQKDNLFYSLGFAQNISPEKPAVIAPPPPPVVLDRDGDGVPDADDKCPDTPGLASLQGCPDRDGDGIADADDKCPDVAGIAKYQGCPIPDTDGDGINDEMDKCPTVKGVARYQGCPIPDTDGDGVNDEEDKCPSRPGPASNQGCPEIAKEVVDKINVAAKNIFFATGSSKLLAKSYKSLNEVAQLLAADETLLLQIDGHTDITGTHDKNMVLSDSRAASVKAYLETKGVTASRISSAGYGPDKPIADNKTAAGRAKNRRVEMVVRNY